MANSHDLIRIFFKFRVKIFLFLVLFFLIQIFLATRLEFVNEFNNNDNHKSPKISYLNNLFLDEKNENPNEFLNKKRDIERNEEISHGRLINNNDITASQKFGDDASSLVNTSLTLDLDSLLPFVPECEIVLKESISAIQRAKSSECKQKLAEVACRVVDDSLYEKRYERLCKNNVTSYLNYVGCFRDEQKNRLLPENFSTFKNNNSPQMCVDFCLQLGFQFAGVQYSVECFCGNNKPSFEIPKINCNMKCPSNNSLYCGGYFAIDVYETGIFRDHELKNDIISLDDINKIDNLKNPPRVARIVYFLTLNGRPLRQVTRLIKTLFNEKHFFLIHVDSRQDYLWRELQSLKIKLLKNIRFMSSRQATIWGGASLLKTLLAGMEELILKATDWDWDYVINLSESDFPLKSNEQLENFLSYNLGKNFVKSHGRDVQKFIQKQGLDKTFFECENRMWRVGNRQLPSGILIDGGSDWIALHRDFVAYIVNTTDKFVKGLKNLFSYTLLPAESFFHTVLRNSVLCPTFIDNNLHVTNWKRRLGCKCQYRHVVDWCGCSPSDFRLVDFNRLQLTESRLIFFGRKFESIVNQGIINKLESWLYPNKIKTHHSSFESYWQSIYHHKDKSPKVDDIILTIGHSLSRLAAKVFNHKYVENMNNSLEEKNFYTIDLPKIKLIEMSSYHQNDEFLGILVHFENKISNANMNIEAWTRIENSFVKYEKENSNIEKYTSSIQNIRIGSDYDQKEQIFRNFAGALGPLTELTLAYNVYADEPLNITFVWLNPILTIQAIQNVSLITGTTANFVKPSLNLPLQPGNWTIKLLTSLGHLVAQIEFLIIPLEYYNGHFLSMSESMSFHTKSSIYNNENLKNIYKKENVPSQKLRDWIDNLVVNFYKVQDLCLEREIKDVFFSKWSNSYIDEKNKKWLHSGSSLEILETSLCSHTQWSSLYPDPKSQIEGIDPQTGLLLP